MRVCAAVLVSHNRMRSSGSGIALGPAGALRAVCAGMSYLLEVRNLGKSFMRAGGRLLGEQEDQRFTAVEDVSFEVAPGATFAIVGESGCGKTTLARMILRLIEPDHGVVHFAGRDLLKLDGEELRKQRRQMQM